ncbi:hypothetical protein ACQYAD_13105 [Neobacillus sp. SM06]|uniref:hypothetical protein n=1 Tax=Neobacillus sp. SM06 TaxID=3422492 RepID=UPI003D2B40B3
MRIVIAIAMVVMILLTGCQQKEVKQYQNGKLIFEGTLDQNGQREKGKLYDSKTGKVEFDGLFRNGLMYKGTLYDKNGKNPRPYEE